MYNPLDSIIKVKSLVDSAVTLKLLRARNLPLIVTFLYREFKDQEQITLPYHYLVQRLGDFLEGINYVEEHSKFFRSGMGKRIGKKALSEIVDIMAMLVQRHIW